jgi:hypothetical protein
VTDDAGFIVKEFSLARMLETCTDFANEKTQLEFVCQSLGTEALKEQSTMPSRQERALNILGEQQLGSSKSSVSTLPTCVQKGKRIFCQPCFEVYIESRTHDGLNP